MKCLWVSALWYEAHSCKSMDEKVILTMVRSAVLLAFRKHHKLQQCVWIWVCVCVVYVCVCVRVCVCGVCVCAWSGEASEERGGCGDHSLTELVAIICMSVCEDSSIMCSMSR